MTDHESSIPELPEPSGPGLIFERVEAGYVFAPTDPIVADYFPIGARYMEDDSRLAYAIGRYVNGYRQPTKLNFLYAPARLLNPEELAEAEWEYELENKLRARGVERGAVKVKELFTLMHLQPRERELLGRPEGDKAMYVWREFFDENGALLVYQQMVLGLGELTGHVRVLPRENRGSYEW